VYVLPTFRHKNKHSENRHSPFQAAFVDINIAAVIAGESSGLVRDITSAA
jgi:hypothetical protein